MDEVAVCKSCAMSARDRFPGLKTAIGQTVAKSLIQRQTRLAETVENRR
jgi:hypothetical protein